MPDIKIKRQKLTTPVEEAYKLLRTNLFFCGRDKKVIAITSSTMNEGKSMISMNLALSLVEAGKKVILIDADLRNSTMTGQLRCTGEKYGLAYYLSDMVTFDQVICSTDYENLDIIMTGRFPPNPAELLSGKTFRNMLDQLRHIYDYVIIDTPPVGSVIDGAIIAESCDGLILVVEANAISYRFVQRVKDQLEKTACPILGVILNKVDASAEGYGRYGRYGHYGRYGRYGRYGQYGQADQHSDRK